jgi:hypothetical protein
MEYKVKLWTTTQLEMPTVDQITYVLHLLDARLGARADLVWERNDLTKRVMGSIIHELLKLPEKGGSQ